MSKVEILYVTNSGLIIRQLKGSEIIPKTVPFSVDYRTLRGVFTNDDSILLRFTFKSNWQSYAATLTFYTPREIRIKSSQKNPNLDLSFLLKLRLTVLLGLRILLGRRNETSGSSSAVLLSVLVGLILFSQLVRILGGSFSKMD